MKKDRVITVRLEDPDFEKLEQKVQSMKSVCDALSLASMARSLIVAGLRKQRNQRNHELFMKPQKVSECADVYSVRRIA
jgi:hypothetical protein